MNGIIDLATVREMTVTPSKFREMTGGRVDGEMFGMEFHETKLPDGSWRRVYKHK